MYWQQLSRDLKRSVTSLDGKVTGATTTIQLRARVSMCFTAFGGHRSRMSFPIYLSNYITIYILLLKKKKIRFLDRVNNKMRERKGPIRMLVRKDLK